MKEIRKSYKQEQSMDCSKQVWKDRKAPRTVLGSEQNLNKMQKLEE